MTPKLLNQDWLDGNPVTARAIGPAIEYYDLKGPGSSDTIASVADVRPQDVAPIIAAASDAYSSWSKSTVYERCEALLRWHQAILANAEELAQLVSLEMGKPISESRREVAGAAEDVYWAATEAPRIWGDVIPSRSHHKHAFTMAQPVGVAFGITPWNFPLAMVTRKVAPALAVGCSIILKPSELTPLCAFALARLWKTHSRAPAGTFQAFATLNPAAITDAVLSFPAVRKVTFTGSSQVGTQLYTKAAAQLRRVSLELGGHAPFLVYSDAELDQVVNGILATKYRNCGQTCISTNRAYVHEAVYDEFIAKLIARVSELKVGDPLSDDTSIGPLVSQKAANKVAAHIHDALANGAHLVLGGQATGVYVQPTILADTNESMRLMSEETFGPVLPITRFRHSDDALVMANNTPYGLAAYVWTQDLRTAHSAAVTLDFGLIGINSTATVETQAPFGGLKGSGIGHENGKWGLESYLDTKYVSLTFA